MARWFDARPDSRRYLDNGRYLADLVTWYHLAWLGETVRTADPRAKALETKGHDFTLHDRRELLALIGDLLAGIIPRYRALAETGRVVLRASGTEPVIRVMVEGENEEQVLHLAKKLAAVVGEAAA